MSAERKIQRQPNDRGRSRTHPVPSAGRRRQEVATSPLEAPPSRTRRRRRTGPTLPQRVAANLTGRCDVRSGERLLVAVSGGRDSTALAHLLRELSPKLQIDMELAHFDHARRSESLLDAEFVRELARQLGVPFHSERWSRPVAGEDAARRARYAFLARLQAKRGGVVAVAHHREDQVETLLARLGRGAGLRGLAGMAWRREGDLTVVRPLLDVSRADITAYLQAQHHRWREDASNQTLAPVRNRIRHRILPVLRECLGEAWPERAFQSMEHLAAVDAWVSRQARQLVEASRRGAGLDRRVLQAAEDSLVPLALQLWLEEAGVEDLGSSHLRALQDLAKNGQNGQSVALPGDLLAVLQDEVIRSSGSRPAKPSKSRRLATRPARRATGPPRRRG